MNTDAPEAMTATVDLLVEGRADDESVMSTVSLVRDANAIIVIDPGMVRDRSQILAPLASLGVEPDGVTDIVLSHHHPDHTLNAALFPNARVHDHWAIYFRDTWTDREADRVLITPSVRLIATPGTALRTSQRSSGRRRGSLRSRMHGGCHRGRPTIHTPTWSSCTRAELGSWPWLIA